ncbi:nucleotidyltransferase family protein [Caulobacter segnis]|uniref:N-acetylmuramate alpha-1-phosphate uridylyltransferase MurU n=1 Tax=Caulobacter segnis TaxID=88688 RepID=UPI00240F867E|nr:nucleotidyltransferase family protein [Caulobacter segnis]MDG2521375.1 nucleotidyltransferase family protein [Caulobacter segnis]
MSGPKTAMVLAAGLGTRMRPLTNDRPKALVEVGGKALIDHMLDRLVAAGVETAVVNVHYFADLMEAHLARRTDLRIVISDERQELLETGGGLKKARALLGDAPVFVANIDSVWTEDAAAIDALAAAWDPDHMDVCLMLTGTGDAIGFHDSGDVFREADGRLRFKQPDEIAPYLYVGVHIAKPAVVADEPDGPFSLTPLWRRLADKGRLHGVAPSAHFMHVGDPAAREAAEARLR